MASSSDGSSSRQGEPTRSGSRSHSRTRSETASWYVMIGLSRSLYPPAIHPQRDPRLDGRRMHGGEPVTPGQILARVLLGGPAAVIEPGGHLVRPAQDPGHRL